MTNLQHIQEVVAKASREAVRDIYHHETDSEMVTTYDIKTKAMFKVIVKVIHRGVKDRKVKEI